MSNPTSPTQAPTLDLVPTDEERLLRESVYGIASSFGPSYYLEQAQGGGKATELWQALGESGYVGVNIAEEYGGGGQGLYELAMVAEECSHAGCPLLPLVFSPAIAGAILGRHGSAEQKERWLPGLASGETKISFAITEPDAGSNSHKISTQAKHEGEGWTLHGTKTYISGVEDAQQILVVAKTGESEDGRGKLSLFVVDAEAEGLSRQHIPTVMEMPDDQWTLFFDGTEVGPDRLVGTEHEGLRAVFDGLNPERVTAAAQCAGLGMYALRKASTYANERAVWGAPIGSHQGVSHPLAEAKIELEHARLMIQKAARLYDAGAPAAEASNMAKFSAAEAGLRSLDRAIQVHGGNGLAREYELAQYWWAVRLLRTAPVSREMILNYVASKSLGLPRSY